MTFKPFYLVIVILYLTTGFCTADILHLKNGRKIVSENIWKENGIYRYKAYGATVGIPADQVKRVEYSKSRNSGFQFDI